MLPPDLASRTQLSAAAQLKPVAPNQQLTDKLAELVPGQRLMAEIQAMLPNGTYRAMIAQRDITLALPFSAKAGDTLELEVVDTDGKLTLALVTRPPTGAEKRTDEAASTTLSRTGQLIANLFGSGRENKEASTALPLNSGQPLAAAPPNSAQDILPQLRQAIVQSGMFYEAHQAEWVAGRFDKAALMQEPQGKLSPQLPAQLAEQQATETPQKTESAAPTRTTPAPSDVIEREIGSKASSQNPPNAVPQTGGASPQLVAREAMPIVQQQLEALANQQFSWQGQVWPGQQMRWEIEEDDARQKMGDEQAPSWQTRLYLSLPRLGELEARIRLNASQIHLDFGTRDEAVQAQLRGAISTLQKQLDSAGLTLGTIAIGALPSATNLAAELAAQEDGSAGT